MRRVASGRAWAMAMALLLCAVALAAPAMAKPEPQVYFLKDGTVRGAGDGILTTVPPPPPDLANPTNNSAPGVRMILPGQHLVAPVQFVQVNATENTGRIWGPVIVALWAPNGPWNQNANVTVSLVEMEAGALPEVGGGGRVLATASVVNDYTNTTLPNATAFVPPDPSNVTGALEHIQAQLLIYALTQALRPPLILILDDGVKDYIIDEKVDPKSVMALRFQLDANGGGPLIPLGQPTAAGQPIQYDFGLTPSFAYIPWYSPDPPAPTPVTPTKAAASPTRAATGATPATPTDAEDTPVVAPAAVLLALMAVALAVRRRK